MTSTSSFVENSRQIAGLVALDGRTFPLRSSRIQARAEGGLATTTLVQEYANPHDVPLEVAYTLPLPADGAVVGYSIQVGERVVRGEIERRDVAHERFRRALEEGHTAGLLDQERADVFTLTLGSLPPGALVRVEITVLQPLAFLTEAADVGPEWEYRFPTVVGVRYSGAPGRVPDAHTLDPDRADGQGTPVRLEVELLVAGDASEAMAPRSPSHAVDVRSEGNGSRVTLSDPSRLDRDVVVRWRAVGVSVGAQLVEGIGLAGDEGRYGALTLTPPNAAKVTFARDLTVLLDASGSMSGDPLDHAKQIVEALLVGLAPADRFELLAFSNDVTTLTHGMVSATPDRVRLALDGLHSLEANGSTEMRKAIVKALKAVRPDSLRQVVLLTDGHVGFEHEVVGQVLSKLPAMSRLHVVGVGSAPNRTLTRGVSRAGRGVELLVATADEARAAAGRISHATAAPVLTALTIQGSAVLGAAPERPRDVLAGQPALIALELRPEGGIIEIEGRLAGDSAPWTHHIQVGPKPGTANVGDKTLVLGAFYGRERVEDCEMQLAAVGDDENLQVKVLAEIEALGLRHHIPTRRTSLVAISEDPTVDPRDPRRRERLAVELPAGVSAEAVGLRSALPVAIPQRAARSRTTRHDRRLSGYDAVKRMAETADAVSFRSRSDRETGMDELEQLSRDLGHLRAMHDEAKTQLEAFEDERRKAEARRREAEVFFEAHLRRLQELEQQMARVEARLRELLHRIKLEERPPMEMSGRLVRLTANGLTVEFEITADGGSIPDNKENVMVECESSWSPATVVGHLSTRPGPHPAGLTVRLALETVGVEAMPSKPSSLFWADESGQVVRVHIR